MEKVTDARRIIPPELWDMVLYRLDDYADIQAVHEVYPELTGLPRKFRPCWKINTVMPLLFPKYLDTKDLLKCRLLSKKWKNAVSVTIDNHQDNRPYNCLDENALNERHFNYFPLPQFKLNTLSVLNVSMYHAFQWQYHRYCLIPAPIPQNIGDTIQHLKFLLCSDDSLEGNSLTATIHPLLNCLQFLPNLKTFKLMSQISYKIDIVNNWSIQAVAIPANVHSLELPSVDPQNPDFTNMLHDVFFETFVNHKKVKKVCLDLRNWSESYATRLPNLTELYYVDLHGGSESLRKMSDFFNRTKKEHHPKKFAVLSPRIRIHDFLEILMPYKVESLELAICAFELSETDNFESLNLPSVTSLKCYVFVESPLRFLKCLHNLQYLTVCLEETNFGENLPNPLELSPFARCLRRYVLEKRFDAGNFECIWTEFPKLQMLTVHSSKPPNGEQNISRQYLAENKSNVYSSMSYFPE